MKKYILILSFATLAACQHRAQFTPAPVNYFNVNDTLLPDYAIQDTLIVVDAISLNKEIAYYEQQKDFGSDSDIANLFYKYCRIK